MSEQTLPQARHEPSDVSRRFAMMAFTGLLAALILSGLLVLWLYPATTPDRRLTGRLPSAPAPQLQSDPARQMQDFLAQERARLNSTGWIDRQQGIAHIPIEDAMRRVAQDGIADWPAR